MENNVLSGGMVHCMARVSCQLLMLVCGGSSHDVREGNLLLVLHCLTNKSVCRKGNDVFPVAYCEPVFFSL